MFQERDYLLENGHQVVDFSMQDRRNLASDTAQFFVAAQSYAAPTGGDGPSVGAALKLIHSREAVQRIGHLMDEHRPDIMHCHNIYHQLTPSIIGAAKRRAIPVVLTLHDYKPVCPTYTRLRGDKVCSECLGGRFANVVKHRCADGSLAKSTVLFAEAVVQRLMGNYDKVDTFIAPSQFMRESVTAHRFDTDRVNVLYNGIDCRAITPSYEDWGYALYLGRLSPEKGVETLLGAHAKIAERISLKIAGTGPLERQLQTNYRGADFLGHLSGTALSEAIRKAALIVIPSEWYENCPMSILEAMAHGKPVLASNIGGIPELVEDGQTGLLFPPGDRRMLRAQLLKLSNAPALRRSFGRNARARAEQHFSLERHNASLLRSYHAAIDRAKSTASHGVSPQFAPPQE